MVNNLTETAPGTGRLVRASCYLLAATLAACGGSEPGQPPDALLAAPTVAIDAPAAPAAPAAGAGVVANTTEIDFAAGGAPAAPAMAASAVGPALAATILGQNPDPAKALATYSVTNLAPGEVVGVPDINARDQVAMTVENAAGVRAYFFNGQTVRDIGTLGGPSATATALNNAGQVTGWAAIDGDTAHAFRWSPSGGMRDLGSPTAGSSFGVDINQRGQVAGYFETSEPGINRFAFRWDERQGMIKLGVLPGESTSIATAINDRGAVTGFTDNLAFAWTPARGIFNIGFGIPRLINNAGQVAGYFESARLTPEAFVWTAATGFGSIGTLGGSSSEPFGMNASGQVVGMSDTADAEGIGHAFLWSRREGMRDLGVLGGMFSAAQAINDSGQVVGTSSYRADVDQPHAFLWTRTQGMRDLNSLIPAAPAGLELFSALAISPRGAIVAQSNAGLVLLEPGAAGTDAPVIGPIVASADPIPVRTPVTFTATFTDRNRADRHRATWNWSGGCSSPPGSITEANGKGRVTGTRTWCTAGTYWVSLTVTDNTGRSTTVARQVTVDNPQAGAVAGGRQATKALVRKWAFPKAPGK